jgi:hypothetical protein
MSLIWELANLHQVIVVSFSGPNVRIVHGVFDKRTRHAELKVSQIVSFSDRARADRLSYLNLLGWIIGTPVGTTMPDFSDSMCFDNMPFENLQPSIINPTK